VRGRGREIVAEPAQQLLEPERGFGIALGKRRLELTERLRRTVPERHSLLDLEVERHPPVVDATAVLDRDERKEALELPGPPHGLLV
jgi:hypothetical protein